MAGDKRKHMSIDDLMRQQEGTLSKRHRLDSSPAPSLDESDAAFDDDESYSEAALENTDEDDTSGTPGHEDVTLDSEQSSGRLNLFKITPKNSPSTLRRKNLENEKAFEAVKTFSSLGISTPLQLALSAMSITSPTEVQVACIPPLLEGMQ
jgi:ATP-dependent RNA helicase DDX49/DBP8